LKLGLAIALSATTGLVVVVLAAASGACTAFSDARLPAGDGGPPIGSGDSGTTSSSGGGREAGCPVRRVPADPPTNTNDAVQKDFVVTVHAINLGLSGAPPTSFVLDRKLGYDLDNACSCTPDPESCAGPAGVGTTSKRKEGCDLDDGIDNASGLMLSTIPLKENPASYANEAIDTGQKGVLLRVKGYNGLADDSRVDILVYRSPGTGGTAPNFNDPNNEWMVDQDDIQNGGSDPYAGKTVGSGYVRGNVLVAKLQSSSFPFNTDADILLTQVQLTANVVPKGGDNFALENGVAVGRWPVADVLSTVGKVKDPLDEQKRICQGALYAEVKKKVCASVDIFDDPAFDNTNRDCNALSTALGFTGSPAKLGTIIEPTRVNPCAGVTVGSCN